MLVRILKEKAGPKWDGSGKAYRHFPGDVYDLPDAEGRKRIEAGEAEALDPADGGPDPAD